MGLLCLVAAASCLLVAGRAEAQPTNAAEGPGRYFERGARDYQAGQFEEAIAEFEEAYKIAPDPILLFNIAQSNRHLGRKERALFFYWRYLEQAPQSAPNRADASRHIAELVDELQREEDARRRARDLALTAAANQREAQRREEGWEEGGGDPSAAHLRRWTVAAFAGPALLRFGREDVDAPAAATFSLAAARTWNVHGHHLQLGVEGVFVPLPFTRLDGTSEATGWMCGGLVVGGVRIPLAPHWALGAQLGAGILWWGGLSEGNPFTYMGQAATGPVPLPSGRVRAEALYSLGHRFFLLLAPSVTFSKTVSAGLTHDIELVSRWELGFGLGYGI